MPQLLSRSTIVLAVIVGWMSTPLAHALSDPNDFCVGDPCVISSNKTADAGIILDFGSRAVVVDNATLTIDNLVGGAVGSLVIRADSFAIIGTGQVKGSSTTNQAGTISIETTGDIEVNGTRSNGAFRFPGSDGGFVTLTAGGSVFGSGKFNLDHDGLIASGGELVITANGNVNLSGDIIAEGGVQGFGGTIDIAGQADVSVTGLIDISGGESGGGSLDLFSVGNMVMGTIDMSAGGDAGDAGIGDVLALGTLNITGPITGNGADNGENCGDAGDLDMASDGDLVISSPITMLGRGLDCSGGFLSLDGALVTISQPIDLSASGTEGIGGDIDLTSTLNIVIAADLRVDGADGAGDLLISSDADLFINGDIHANGRGTFGAGASLVELDSVGALTLAGDVDASGGVQGSGGDISIDGCSVRQTASSTVTATAAGGLITILGSDGIDLSGAFVGELTSVPAIEIRYRAAGPAPDIIDATFNIPPALIASATFPSCNLCVNLNCDDGNVCTDDSCDPVVGCMNTANTIPCDDGNACTSTDVCGFGICLGLNPLDCDDSNLCTDDSCDPGSGCQNAPNIDPCDDSDACTDNDTCGGGSCAGSVIDCADGNECTDDSCDSVLGCMNTANTAPCDDGDACTSMDTCASTLCLGTSVDCNDGNLCTDDSCDSLSGCQNAPNTSSCDDSDACTENDICGGGTCAGSSINCDDSNECTDDVCTAGTCDSTPNTLPCDDGDACTVADVCSSGTCLSGAPATCGDTNPCTIDSCDSGTGCVNDPIVGCADSDSDGIIDDEDVCTTLDWTASPTSPPNQNPVKLVFKMKNLSKPAGEQGILIKGFFNVAAPAQTIEPEINGIHINLSDADGTIYDLNVPGGSVGEPQMCDPRDGWSAVLGTKSRWKYKNKSGALPPACLPGSARGLSTLQIKDLRSGSKSALQAKIKIKGGDVDRIPTTPLTHIQADLVLAAQPSAGVASTAAIDGQCAESVIAGTPIGVSAPKPFCKPKFRNAALDKISCKGE